MPRKDKSGHQVPERRLQAQRTLLVTGRGLSTGARTPEGLQRISEANLKHGRQTKDKLVAQRHAANVGRRASGDGAAETIGKPAIRGRSDIRRLSGPKLMHPRFNQFYLGHVDITQSIH